MSVEHSFPERGLPHGAPDTERVGDGHTHLVRYLANGDVHALDRLFETLVVQPKTVR